MKGRDSSSGSTHSAQLFAGAVAHAAEADGRYAQSGLPRRFSFIGSLPIGGQECDAV